MGCNSSYLNNPLYSLTEVLNFVTIPPMSENDEHLGFETFAEQQKRLGTRVFYMNDADIVYAKPNDRRAIATYGLGGCTGIAILFENPTNTSEKGALVAHYNPILIRENIYKLQLGQLLSDIATKAMKAKVIIVHPGDEDPTSPTGYKAWSYYNNRALNISNFIKSILGEETSVISSGYYDIGRDDDGSNIERGTIIVEFPNDKENPQLRIGGKSVNL